MLTCFNGGFRQEDSSLEDQVAWLKSTLQRERLQRQVVEQQLCQEQEKCALLEREVQQAAVAAHEMGESLRQYFSSRASGSECSEPEPQWGSASPSCLSEQYLAGGTPQSIDCHHPFSKQRPKADLQPMLCDTRSTLDQGNASIKPASTPGHLYDHSSSSASRSHHHNQPQPVPHSRHLQQQRLQVQLQQPARSSCSSTKDSQIRCVSQLSNMSEYSPLLNRQPSLSRGSTARMQRHVLQVADQLKDLAISWKQRLDEYQPLHIGPTGAAAVAAAAASIGADGAAGRIGCDSDESQVGIPEPAALPSAALPAAAAPGGHLPPAAAPASRPTSRLSRCNTASPPPAEAGAAGMAGVPAVRGIQGGSWGTGVQQQEQQRQLCQGSTASSQEPGASSTSQQPSHSRVSQEWGSSSCATDNHSSSAAVCANDGAGELSSSCGSFVRYRSSYQGRLVGEIAEGEEGGQSQSEAEEVEEGEEQQEDEQGSDSGCSASAGGSEDESAVSSEQGYETDEEAEAEQLQWHVHQIEQQARMQQQQRLLQQQVPKHSQLQQQIQQQLAARHQEWNQQQQQQVGLLGSWNGPSRDPLVARCAITRGAAMPRSTPCSSQGVGTPGPAGPGSAGVAAAAKSPLARTAAEPGSRGVKPLPPAPHTQPQQQQQQQLQDSLQAHQQAGWQQQQQQARHKSLSLRRGGMDAVPQDLKCMAPLRRHQQYLAKTG